MTEEHPMMVRAATVFVVTDIAKSVEHYRDALGFTVTFQYRVNTQNWDAVEARDTSYIHSTNGSNCYVGDIHYGDVTPPKKGAVCTLFADPFASFSVPTETCTFTNLKVTVPNTTLTPGTYCGGINISKDTTLSPGVYHIQNGDLTVSGAANVTATEVTFLISGKDSNSNSNINVNTTGTLTMSPNTSSAAGQWAGFVFYYDQSSAQKNTSGVSTIEKAKVNLSGIIYLAGQKFAIKSGAVVTVNPGSIIADFILPDKSSISPER